MMEMLKFGKFAALSLALAVVVGCSSKGGDAAGEGATDPNAGYGANTGAVDGSLSEEAALRAITTFYFEYYNHDYCLTRRRHQKANRLCNEKNQGNGLHSPCDSRRTQDRDRRGG